MSEKTKVLYVTQEMDPYVVMSDMGKVARELPQYAQENGMEIRILMPRYGTINERRHRLHEVVRLSGINIIIDEEDYPLIIKVASLPGARMQVYFLDNDDFFHRPGVFGEEDEPFYHDNPERMIFFCKGVIETVKKFGWPPDIIHLHGWMTSLIPLYLKTAYKNEPVFQNAQIIYSVYSEGFKGKLSDNFLKKAPLIHRKVDQDKLAEYAEADNSGLNKGAITYSDAVIIEDKKVNGSVKKHLEAINKPVLELNDPEDLENYVGFYQSLLG